MLRDVARIDRKSIAPENIETGSKYVGLENIESGGRLINLGTVTNGELASSKFQFTREHILYGKLRPYLAKIALPEFDGICSTDIVPVLPSSKLDRRFLVHFLRQPNKVRLANSMATGANLPRLSPTALGEMIIPLPPLDEQRRIAAILDKAEELRAKRRQTIDHLDALTQSIFNCMFVDPLQVRPSYSVKELAADIPSAIRTGPFGSQLLTSEFTDEGVAVLGIDNAVDNKFTWKKRRFISQEKYSELERYTVRPGDFIVTIMGTLGRCAVIPEDIPVAINTKHLCCITLDRTLCLPEFLQYYFLNHPTARRYLGQTTKGSIMGGLNMGIIKNLPVELPSLEEQEIFTTRVAGVERLKNLHLTQLAELDDMFGSLQHQAFSEEPNK